MASDHEQAYRGFLDALTAGGRAWTLEAGDDSAVTSVDGRDAVPLWASRERAEAAATGGWEHDEPVSYDAMQLLEWFGDLDERYWITVESDDEGGYLVPPDELEHQLLEALGRAGTDPRGPDGEQAAAIAALDAEDRYDWFCRWVALDRGAWAIGDDENLLQITDEDDPPGLALWPVARFALDFARAEGIDAHAHRLTLHGLVEDLERMKATDERVVIFPTPDGRECIVTEPDALIADLRDARETAD